MTRNCNDVKLKSWVDVPAQSDFPIQNLPYGVFSVGGEGPRIGVAIGDSVLDVRLLSEKGFLISTGIHHDVLAAHSLNSLMSLDKSKWSSLRARISELLDTTNTELRSQTSICAEVLKKQSEIILHMPVKIGDYIDFYSSVEHATNVGKMFRDEKNPLLPNWKHIPIGYHGRASSVVVSGTPVKRPAGQLKLNETDPPIFAPCKQLDFELEMGFFTAINHPMGEQLPISKTPDAIFGMVLVNDWSARDIQRWEYVPLGPFLAKSFATSISPWVITMDALEPFRTETPAPDVEQLPYLRIAGKHNFDIDLTVTLKSSTHPEELTICKTNYKYMYWNMNQQLAHAGSNGTNIQVGDLYASGTISGPTPDSYGSMLELCWKGTKPIQMPDGTQRNFIADGDTVTMRGSASRLGFASIGFGEVSGVVLPS